MKWDKTDLIYPGGDFSQICDIEMRSNVRISPLNPGDNGDNGGWGTEQIHLP